MIEAGEDVDRAWRRHVYAYVTSGMCPRCQNQLDAYGRCHPAHGRWLVDPDDGLAWSWER